MNGHRACQHFLALKKHFGSDKYNVFEEPRVFIPEASFFKRKDWKLWEQLARLFPKTPDLLTFMISNMVYGNEGFVYNLEQGEELNARWIKTSQSLTHLFQTDLEKIVESCGRKGTTVDELFNFQGASPPVILNMYLGKYIRPETLIILNANLGLVENWKGQMSTFFTEEITRINRATPFVKYQKDRVKAAIESFQDDLHITVCDTKTTPKS